MSSECDQCGECSLDCQCNPYHQPSYINHPSHYQGQKFEVIDIIEDFHLDFLLGNSIKYILRAGKKDDVVQDLKKAIWYLDWKCKQISDSRKEDDSASHDEMPKL